MKKFIFYITLLLLISCKKKEQYIYEVDPVTVNEPGSGKPNSKTTLEFVSIAYYDLFGNNISQGDLIKLNTVYASFGDKKLIEDMIIRNFLKRTGVKIPTITELRDNPEKFIIDSYKKFYNREPSPTEKWYMKDLISKDAAITPETLYYAFLTSNEYRNY